MDWEEYAYNRLEFNICLRFQVFVLLYIWVSIGAYGLTDVKRDFMRSFCKNCLLFLMILILSFVLSCNKNPVGTTTEFNWYPLAVGNSWEYSRFIASINIQPDTTYVPFSDTFFSTGQVQVTKKDTLLDSIPVFELLENLKDTLGSYSSLNYFNNLEDGLYYYGFNGTSYLPPLQSTTQQSLHFKGKYFRNIREIIDWLEKAIPLSFSSSDFLDYYLPPRKRIQYPLKIGSQWTYTQTGDPWRIDGKVVNREFVTIPAGMFYCYKIQWLYDLNEDGRWDSDIEFFQYVHSIGVVKWSILLKNIQYTDEFGNVIYTFDVIEETQLTDFSVQ